MLRLAGAAGQRLDSLTPPALVPSIDISLTDEYPYGQAFVVLAARPPGTPPLTGAEAGGDARTPEPPAR
jgi:holo-[acyl-carrier protein] synthase